MTQELRHIRNADDPACIDIAALWTHYITHTTITFNPVPKTPSDIRESVQTKAKTNDPMIAAYDGDIFLGFATYGPFRNGEGYKFSREHTIMLAENSKGMGLGHELMNALQKHAIKTDIQSLWAGITGSNTAAIGFHGKLGFEHVIQIPEIGWKFDRWHDLVLMRKRLR